MEEMSRKCHECRHDMKLMAAGNIDSMEELLASKWKCTHCGHVEIESLFEKLCKFQLAR